MVVGEGRGVILEISLNPTLHPSALSSQFSKPRLAQIVSAGLRAFYGFVQGLLKGSCRLL